jgi:DNA primase
MQRIKDKLPILEYAKRFTPMKESLSNKAEYFGKCPDSAHDDSRASFCVNTNLQVFHCKGCGVKGNVVGLYALMNNMAEDDAKFALGRELGVVNDRRMDDAESMLSRAAGRYVWQLERKLDAMDYLTQERGLTVETVKRFGLGFCWGTEFKETTPDQRKLAIETGLARLSDPNEPNAPLRSFMAGRITFPVKDRSGRIVGFAGRLVPSSRSNGPKYLNTQETQWFHKSELLYGANEATSGIARSGYAAVVEGYMDVIGLHQAGADNAVAVMGASANEATFKNLWSMTRRVVFCLDGDAAGDAGALRSAMAAASTMEDGCEIAIARLPAGVDPDEFVLKEGLEVWQSLMACAMPLARFLMVARSQDHDLSYPEGRARFLGDAREVAATFTKAPLVQEQIVGEARGIAAAALVATSIEFSSIPEDFTLPEVRAAIALLTRHARELEARATA